MRASLLVALLAVASASRALLAQDPAADEWPIAAKDSTAMRFSALTQVTAANVGSLQLKWKFDTGVYRGHEAAPIVAGGTMYVITPYPNYLFALDLAQGGRVKWRYEAKPEADAQGKACCDHVSRGAAYYDGKVFINALDGHTIAVDAATGRELWKRKMGEVSFGETMTMAPFIAKGKVIVGNSGSQLGVRGWIAALDPKTGAILWKAYSTGPDVECLIGPGFHPFYAMDRGHDLGTSTWPGDQWKLGGGTVWGWISYDPELDLIYYGTGDPAPWNAEVREGDNKWSSGVFARRPDTGEAVWYYQYTPHDLYGHDAVNEHTIVDLVLKPDEPARKVLLHADRNGHLYVLDRITGEVISATPFVRVNSTGDVNLQTGRLSFNDAKKPALGLVVRDISPAAPGGKDWQPSAFSPRTGLLYLPHQTLAMDFELLEPNYIKGTPYIGARAKFYADPVDPGDGSLGAFTAWDPVARKAAWKIRERFPVWGGTVATAGDVVFYGTMDRWFKAIDARTGAELWRFQVDSGIVSQPITYRGPDGKQYIAVLSGVGGWAGAVVSKDLDVRDPTAAHGFANAMKELPKYTGKGGTLYVFALP